VISFYFDEHVPLAITRQLRRRGVDVLTVQEDGRRQTDDEDLLRRATELSRLFFSQDEDVLSVARRFQTEKIAFTGVLFAEQVAASIGVLVRDLDLIAKAGRPTDFQNLVWSLPL